MTSGQPARRVRSSKLWPAAAVVLWVAVAACSGGSTSPTVASVTSESTTTSTETTGSSLVAATPLAKAQAYAQCMRSHGVANFPDPVSTPSGGYGFRTKGIDPKSSAFQSAGQTCDALVPEGWEGT